MARSVNNIKSTNCPLRSFSQKKTLRIHARTHKSKNIGCTKRPTNVSTYGPCNVVSTSIFEYILHPDVKHVPNTIRPAISRKTRTFVFSYSKYKLPHISCKARTFFQCCEYNSPPHCLKQNALNINLSPMRERFWRTIVEYSFRPSLPCCKPCSKYKVTPNFVHNANIF